MSGEMCTSHAVREVNSTSASLSHCLDKIDCSHDNWHFRWIQNNLYVHTSLANR